MKRSVFFIISALIACFFGGIMFIIPDIACERFGLAYNLEIGLIFRWFGVMLLSSGALNFFFNNEPNSCALHAVLTYNIIFHSLILLLYFIYTGMGILKMQHVFPGIIAHVLQIFGFVFYLLKLKKSYYFL
jgi:hypothetical protein